MNYAAITGILRVVLPAAISFVVGKGWITSDVAAQIGSVLAAIVAAGGWSAVANTNLNLAKSVASVPGLSVHVDETAPADLQQAAVDRTVHDIVPAAPQPFVTSTVKQTRGF